MNSKKRAYVSVYNKERIAEFCQYLVEYGYEIVATEGTCKVLTEAGIKAISAHELTGYPEPLGGKLRALHPAIYTGIIANELTEEQLSELDALGSSVSNLHVFCWTGNNERHPLFEGEAPWRDYFAHTPRDGRERAVILEFVENDSEEAFLRDAETLKTLAAGCFGPASALICNSRENRIFDAFDNVTLQTLREKTALSNHVVTPDELAAHPHRYENTEYLFSTWGMPVLTEEEIRRYFPALKAVFYAAGSVQRMGESEHYDHCLTGDALRAASCDACRICFPPFGASPLSPEATFILHQSYNFQSFSTFPCLLFRPQPEKVDMEKLLAT